MSTAYKVRLTPLLGTPTPIDLPRADDVEYGLEAVTVTWNNPLTDWRSVLEALGMRKRLEQMRLNNDKFTIWTPSTGVIPVTVAVEEIDRFTTGTVRTVSFKAVGQMPSYRWSLEAESFRVVFYRADYFAAPDVSGRVAL